MNHKYKIMIFHFVSLTIDFLKMLIDLGFLIPTLRLFHSFIQYGKKKNFFAGFCSRWKWSSIEADDNLSK